ncbi:hypothetical protein OROMI_032056 [Orobanche minor]
MSLIDVGQSSKEFATEVEADFPSKPLKKFAMKKSSKMMMIDKKICYEVEEEAVNEKMKVLEVKKKAEESEDEDGEAFNELIKLEVKKMAEESINPVDIVKSLNTRFRAEIHGEFDTGVRKLKEHFKEYGSIKRIRVRGVDG